MTARGLRSARIPRRHFLIGLGCAALLPGGARAAADAPGAQLAQEIGRQARDPIRMFYADRSHAPLWVRDGRIGPEADKLVDFVGSAALDGLPPKAYRPDKLRSALARARGGGKPKALAKVEMMLSDTLVRFAADQRRAGGGEMIWATGALRPDQFAPDSVLRSMALSSDPAAYVTTMAWMNPHYLRLRELLAVEADGEAQRRLRRNLVRASALPGAWTRHVLVDAGSGRLWYYEAGRLKGEMKVVVGKATSPTPQLAGSLQYAILNPYWNVPVDLARNSIAPKVLAGQTLRAMRMEALSDWTDKAVRLDPAKIDWKAVADGRRELRVRQLPGANNSMGRVKFMFPNDLGIYLHDTPERELLQLPQRHLSNGCVRLEDADGLGQWLLGRPVASRNTAPEQVVVLPAPVPVYLTYFTAGEDDGKLVLMGDLYGRDGTRQPPGRAVR